MLKGGTLLQYRLPIGSRATRDLDGIVRLDMDAFAKPLDESLATPWGVVSFSRSPMTEFDVLGKLIKPRRFDLRMSVSGKLWRKVKVEISPDEGARGTASEPFPPPSLAHFGLNISKIEAGYRTLCATEIPDYAHAIGAEPEEIFALIQQIVIEYDGDSAKREARLRAHRETPTSPE